MESNRNARQIVIGPHGSLIKETPDSSYDINKLIVSFTISNCTTFDFFESIKL